MNEKVFYIKKWVIVKHAIIFSYNNKTVHTKFFDKTDIIIDSINKEVFYINK